MSRTGLQILIIAFAVIVLMIGIIFLRDRAQEEANGSYPNITIIGTGGQIEVLALDQLPRLDSEGGNVKYQNRMGNWGSRMLMEGPRVATLVERVGGIDPGEILRVTSTDGYFQDYSYYNLYPDPAWLALQGPLVLAMESDGTSVPGWEDGPSTAFLPEDEEFSNNDSKYTSAPGTGFFLNPSAGARFVRNAWKFEVLDTGRTEWTVWMEGVGQKNLTLTELGIIAQDHGINITSEGKRWSGVPLWRTLGLIDGEPLYGEESYNYTYSIMGYEIEAEGAEGISFSSHELQENDSVVFANAVDGSVLGIPALVTPSTVIEDIVGLRIHPLWMITVHGERGVVLHYSELSGLDSIQGRGGYLKVTGTVVGPFELKGVDLMAVLKLSGQLPSEYSVEVTAADGYSIMLSKEEASGNVAIFDLGGVQIGQGDATPLIYYEEDGSTDFEGKPLRLGYIHEDGLITDSHYWVKEVKTLTIKRPVKEWNLSISGPMNYVVNRTAFEAGATCSEHRKVLNLTVKGETHTYQGLPIWLLLGTSDGRPDPEGHYIFNDDLARAGYEVKISAADGYNATFNSTFLWRNDKVILAFLEDGEILPEGHGPLRVVGEDLAGKQMVRQVVSIEILLPESK